jgi:hypothetical protein
VDRRDCCDEMTPGSVEALNWHATSPIAAMEPGPLAACFTSMVTQCRSRCPSRVARERHDRVPVALEVRQEPATDPAELMLIGHAPPEHLHQPGGPPPPAWPRAPGDPAVRTEARPTVRPGKGRNQQTVPPTCQKE